ncbi:MAG TPA: response regulator [Planctomycetota bacterium]|nr:response regulator [Planctomycetota bacterium]
MDIGYPGLGGPAPVGGRPLRILFVEDDPLDAELEERQLRQEGFEFVAHRVDRPEDLERELAEFAPDLILSDYSMPRLSGPTVLERVRRQLPDIPFIFVSGTIGEERAIEAMRNGATDYVVKDRMGGLAVRVRRALHEAAEKERRRRLEVELRQSQKLDALGRLAGAIAHDFNNLLTAILSYGELALSRLEPHEPARADVQQMHRAGESAVALTRQLLAFSRKSDLALKAVDLNAVVGAMAKLLSRLVGGAVRIEVRLEPNLPAVRADVGGLEQILLNLALNARDAMPSGGRLLLTTSLAQPPGSGKSAAPLVLLSAGDEGQGIDAQTLPRIFEPFFTTKPPGRGTGLGLSTVYGLVQAFGGSVAVTSELGRGTTFWVYLPVAEAPPDAPRETVVTPRLHTGRETLLVAEDDPVVRALVVQVLTTQGYTVLEAPDGAAALAVSERHPGEIHLLLTDAIMPGIDGPALAERLRQRRESIKVVIMSGRSEPEEPYLESGMVFLRKPFTPLSLSEQVRRCLDGPAS